MSGTLNNDTTMVEEYKQSKDHYEVVKEHTQLSVRQEGGLEKVRELVVRKNNKSFNEEVTWVESLPQIIFLVGIALLLAYSAYDLDYVISVLQKFIDWVQDKPGESSFGIILIYVIFVIIGFPILYITVALGYAYSKAYGQGSSLTSDPFLASQIGLIFSFCLISASVLLGALLAFQISRHWLAKTIKNFVFKNHRSFFAIDQILTQNGWKTVILLRLTPLPFSFVSYFLGITKVCVQ